MRVSSTEIVRALFQASTRDPGRLVVNGRYVDVENCESKYRKSRVAINIRNGNIEITRADDPRGREEHIIHLDPYTAPFRMLRFSDLREALQDIELHKTVASEVQRLGAECRFEGPSAGSVNSAPITNIKGIGRWDATTRTYRD